MKTKILLFVLIIFMGFFSCEEGDTTFQEGDITLKISDTNSLIGGSDIPDIQSIIREIQVDKEALLIDLRSGELAKTRANLRSGSSIKLDRAQLFQTYLGLSVKGSGGGGGFLDGLVILNEILEKTDRVKIYDVSTADDDKLYIVSGGIGAPTALRENLDGLIESIKASVFTLANQKGKELGGILSVESGSVNATIAMLLSIELGIPLMDADGAGRSVPKLSNLSYAHESYAIAPTILASAPNPGVDIEVLFPSDADDAENLIRNTISKPGFGQIGGLALWAQSGSELKASSIVRNTYSDAYDLGIHTFLSVFFGPEFLDLYFGLDDTLIESFDGILSDFKVETKGGFDITTLSIELNNGQEATISALNEDLLMQINDRTVITAPHLLSYIVELPTVPFPMYYPLNNGDPNLMTGAIGNKIHVIAFYADKRLYDYEDTFLDILKDVFGYSGPVMPPAPSS